MMTTSKVKVPSTMKKALVGRKGLNCLRWIRDINFAILETGYCADDYRKELYNRHKPLTWDLEELNLLGLVRMSRTTIGWRITKRGEKLLAENNL